MTIDIISLLSKQFACLTADQIDKVRAAQLKKDEYKAEMEEEKRKRKFDLASKGMIKSCLYEKECQALTNEYNDKVNRLRDGLLFYLEYGVRPEFNNQVPAEYVDYSLPTEDRLGQVKNYYLAKYSTASERFQAFQKDTTAPTYLGEYYAALYDYFMQAV